MSLKGRLPSSLPRPLTTRYYLFVMASTESFVNPILVLFMLEQGLSYTQIGLVNGMWWVAWIVSEIPTGYLGDRFGRKNSLLAGTTLKVIAITGFGFSSTFGQILAFQALWAISVTLRTGALSAWLYDMLQQQYDTEEFTRIQGRGSTLGLLLGTAGAVIGGWLGEAGFTLPFLLAAGVTVIGIPVVWSFPSIRVDADPPSIQETKTLLRDEFTKPPLRSFVLYTGVFTGTTYMVYNLFVQPVSTDLGLNKELLGWFYGLLTLASAAGSYSSDWLKTKFGVKRVVIALPLLLSLAFLAPVVFPVLALPMFVLMQSSAKITAIFRRQYVNDHTESVGRTTVLSAASMVYGLIALPIEVGFGLIGDAIGQIPAIAVGGGLVAVSSIAILLLEPPVSTELFSVVASSTSEDH